MRARQWRAPAVATPPGPRASCGPRGAAGTIGHQAHASPTVRWLEGLCRVTNARRAPHDSGVVVFWVYGCHGRVFVCSATATARPGEGCACSAADAGGPWCKTHISGTSPARRDPRHPGLMKVPPSCIICSDSTHLIEACVCAIRQLLLLQRIKSSCTAREARGGVVASALTCAVEAAGAGAPL